MRLTRGEIDAYRALRRKDGRQESGQFLLEGWRALAAAVDASAPILEAVVAADQADRPDLIRLRALGVPIRTASPRDLQRICATEEPQGVVLRLRIVAARLDDAFGPGEQIWLGLDAVSDPGNVGTIIRAADWFGAAGVLLGRGCVDPWNDKVVRSSVGSLFHVAIVPDVDLPGALAAAKSRKLPVIAADAAGATPLHDWHPPTRCIVVLGSEAHGVSDEAAALADQTIAIPRRGRAESLNVAVAAGIILDHVTGRARIQT
jgi:TrmH family RNA methyltransferase